MEYQVINLFKRELHFSQQKLFQFKRQTRIKSQPEQLLAKLRRVKLQHELNFKLLKQLVELELQYVLRKQFLNLKVDLKSYLINNFILISYLQFLEQQYEYLQFHFSLKFRLVYSLFQIRRGKLRHHLRLKRLEELGCRYRHLLFMIILILNHWHRSILQDRLHHYLFRFQLQHEFQNHQAHPKI